MNQVMVNTDNTKKTQAPCFGNMPRGVALRNELANYTHSVEGLESANSYVPVVSEDGNSDCPFAGKLYRQKEEAEAEVLECVHVLNRYLSVLKAEKERHENELDTLKQDRKKLNRKEPSESYEKAIRIEEENIRSAQEDMDAVSVTILRIDAAMEISKKKKYPTQEQEDESSSTTENIFTILEAPNQNPEQEDTENELDDLITLGPLDQKEAEEELEEDE